jgi:lipoyl(octanoyl) transferase
MNPPICRWLPTESADGPTNMARDEALLLSAEKGVASFRLYTWSEATLSLGYFQPEALRQSDPLLATLPFVRRSSGGGAIVHHREVTYALALPNGLPWQTKESWLCRMHHLLVEVLRTFGVESRTVVCGEEKKLGEVLCFQHQTPGDLLIGKEKISLG